MILKGFHDISISMRNRMRRYKYNIRLILNICKTIQYTCFQQCCRTIKKRRDFFLEVCVGKHAIMYCSIFARHFTAIYQKLHRPCLLFR